MAALPAGLALAAPRVTACDAPDAPAGPRLQVTVTNARTAKGEMAITVYGDRPAAFLARDGKLARQRLPITGPETQACFAFSAPGDYAIAVYHDENADHDFNRSVIGLPTEGFGFSNDAPTAIGLPRFEEARFPLPSGQSRIAIRLRYCSVARRGCG